jgi:hypothetical protein
LICATVLLYCPYANAEDKLSAEDVNILKS